MNDDMPFAHQASQVLCWEACARMMWMWKYKKSPDARYAQVVDQFKMVNAGMDWNSLDFNIFRPLGMERKRHPGASDLRGQLRYGPVTTTLNYIPSRPQIQLPKGSGHAVVVLSIEAASNEYRLVDPLTNAVSSRILCRDYAIRELMRILDSRMGSYLWFWASGLSF